MFKNLAKAVHKQLDVLKAGTWFEVDLPKDELWNLYLSSFPEGSNPIYKERTEHDCNCCKNFIRDIGGLVSVKDNEVMTIWDVRVGGAYQVVVDALAKRVREAKIRNVYSNQQAGVGVEKSFQQLSDGSSKQWNHFFGSIPQECVRRSPTELSEISATIAVFKRGLEEITDNALDMTLELMDQNSIYRGGEFKSTVVGFRNLKKKYVEIEDALLKDRFLWANYKANGSRVRNTAIGTLLQDLSADIDLDVAVKSFEAKVAPTNYRRPTPLITKSMINQALKVIKEDGLEDSLQRRFAVLEDISVNDILFADRNVKSSLRDSLQDSLMAEVKEKAKDFSKLQEISIGDFISKVLPTASSLEVCFESNHQPNLVSLIAPLRANSQNLFKWNNPFSWSYNGNVTDSIKERVKAAGGKVDGYMRVSLSWYNHDDLDLHVFEPKFQGQVTRIHYAGKVSRVSGGNLDVDMNAGGGTSRTPVENICWPIQHKMLKGDYSICVNNFAKRESIDVGFELEIECADEIYKFHYNKPVGDKLTVELARVSFDGAKITEVKDINPDAEVGSLSKEAWGIDTNKFHKVSLMTLSPNHWHGSEEGNKHYIFILEGCKNQERARGFYNEFLPAKYNKYRKVFEVLGDKTKCELSDKQLSGLGFSSTKSNSIVCKVSGQTSRMLKILF